jgi:diguanylate cyclase (GGDEF)-like protein
MQPCKRTQEMTKEELQEAITTDYLTGLRNKHAFDIEDKRRKHVVSIELDNLKYFNDNFGHQTGDEMLINFGNALQ